MARGNVALAIMAGLAVMLLTAPVAEAGGYRYDYVQPPAPPVETYVTHHRYIYHHYYVGPAYVPPRPVYRAPPPVVTYRDVPPRPRYPDPVTAPRAYMPPLPEPSPARAQPYVPPRPTYKAPVEDYRPVAPPPARRVEVYEPPVDVFYSRKAWKKYRKWRRREARRYRDDW